MQSSPKTPSPGSDPCARSGIAGREYEVLVGYQRPYRPDEVPVPLTPSQVDTYAISVITEAEIWRLPGLGSLEERLIDDLLSLLTIVSIDSAIARTAARLGRTRKTRLPDLLIAATAIEHRLSLVTGNTKDFRGIPGLKTYTHLP